MKRWIANIAYIRTIMADGMTKDILADVNLLEAMDWRNRRAKFVSQETNFFILDADGVTKL
ncbi:MAG: hypothetical protein ABI986_12035 [Chloroflexota bacterium]